MRYGIISAFNATAYDCAMKDPEDICGTAKKADLRSEKRLRNQVEEKDGDIAGVRLGLYRINKEEGGKLCSQLLGTRERFHKPVYDEAVIEFTWIFNEAMLAKKSTTPSRFSIFKARKSIPFALSSEL
jgi:hypothetical protein